jgi:predicted nucleotidyltransferase
MKNRYNIKIQEDFLVLKALGFFVENPYSEIYLREFGRKMEISPNSAQRFLNLFLKQGFIIEFWKGNLRYFKANLNSIVFRNIKITFSLKRLEDSGLIMNLKENFSNVVLFGSISKGTDDIGSDVDILCIGIKKGMDFSEFEKKLEREINPHIFTLARWKEQKKENKAFYQNVLTGINLVGEMPLVD